MNYKKIYILIFVSIFLIALGINTKKIALAIQNKTSIGINIDKKSFLNPDFLFLDIKITGATSTFNSVSASVNYDSNIIEVKNIIFDNSFCSIIATTSIDNLNGKTTISCGNPNANASSTSQVARLKIKKIQEGFTNIKLNNSTILSADGLANNILNDIENHTLMIIKKL